MTQYRQAKNSVVANLEKIKTFLNKGLTRNQVYKKLKEEELISCKQRYFYDVINQYIDMREYNNRLPQPIDKTISPGDKKEEETPELLAYIEKQGSKVASSQEATSPMSSSSETSISHSNTPTELDGNSEEQPKKRPLITPDNLKTAIRTFTYDPTEELEDDDY